MSIRAALILWSVGLLLLVALAGCCTAWHGPEIVTGAAGVRLCAKHRIPLVTARGYRIHMERGMSVDPGDEVARIEQCYPNAVPWYEWLAAEPKGDPAVITYCPRCEEGAKHLR